MLHIFFVGIFNEVLFQRNLRSPAFHTGAEPEEECRAQSKSRKKSVDEAFQDTVMAILEVVLYSRTEYVKIISKGYISNNKRYPQQRKTCIV
ncbi:hypothetical protein CEXT_297921 [Caerostris extrusa]|uniref:Uncharacterized protein n=1 Tax=Caerostris extrusa TaxID=172846 RepID=A0AAV4TZ88_CAEEX|nr:hypothetical protein CEXT_297921 [Caerostris extrusa]